LDNGWFLYKAVKKSYIYSTLFTVRTVLYGSLIAAFILSLFVSGLIANTIVKPVMNVTSSMINISEGEGDLTKRIEIVSTYDEEISNLAGAFNKFVNQIEAIIASVSGAAINITDQTQTLQRDSQAIDAMATNQNETLETMANSVENVSNKIANVNDHSQIVLDSNTMMQDTVSESMTTVTTMQNQMNTIEMSVDKTSNDLNELGKWIDAINTMLMLIKDVSDQTNLLALNAAIEAARAGEAGKGFAVVADEVRKLAEKTASSAGEIETIIKNIDSKTTAAIESMTVSLTNVGTGREYVNKTVISLNTLSQTLSTTVSMIDGVISEIKDISELSQGFYGGIESVSDTANIISGQISELNGRVTVMTTVAGTMSEMINRFKYRENGETGETHSLTLK